MKKSWCWRKYAAHLLSYQLPSSLSASIALSLRPPTFDTRRPAFCQGFLAIHFHLLLLLRISKKCELTFMVALHVNDAC